MSINTLERRGAGTEAQAQAAALRRKHEKRILATMTGLGFDNYGEVNAETERKFLRMYPTREAFAGRSADFLEMIRENNSREKFRQYEEAMDGFLERMYGDSPRGGGSRGREVRRGGEALEAEREWKQRVGQKMERFLKRRTSEELTRREGLAMLGRAQIEGAPMIDAKTGREEVLTREMLERAELEPKFEVKIEDVTIGFSEIFKVGKRDATVGYVEKGGEVFARSYYRSGSQGMWRYLPDRTQDPATGRVVWYGKGPSEEAVTLPNEIQKVLNEKGREFREGQLSPAEMSERQRLVQEARTKAFYGTAGNIMSQMPRFPGDGRKDGLAREMAFRPKYNFDNTMRPDELKNYFGLLPDFDAEVNDYRAKSDIYGDFNAEVFESKDRSLKWTMLEDARGRAWVGQVETNAPITSTGCRREWVAAGPYAVPLYEYESQDRGYGNKDDRRGEYVSMWDDYLSKMPVIKEYKEKRG